MRVLLFLLLLAVSSLTRAQTYADGFENAIAPQFPLANGQFVRPTAPLNPRLAWFLGELAPGQTTTADEVNEQFDSAWLASIDVPTTISFINSVRTAYPNGRITDLVQHTPHRLVAVIDTPGSGFPSGYLVFGTRYAAPARIIQLGVSSFQGSVSFPEDQGLALDQAADKFLTLSSDPALLVARVRPNGICEPVIARNPASQRATGSVFKAWVLGAVARGVAANSIQTGETLPLTAGVLASGGVINAEPLGTNFPVSDLATMMMGISDNTATDMLLVRAGRSALNQIVVDWGMPAPPAANPLLPFMGVSETFHLFRSFPLATAEAWPSLSEAQQVDFLQSQIVPLGNSSGSFFHQQLLTRVTWRASPQEICQAWTALRRGYYAGSEAFALIDRAMSASVALPNVRAVWDRAWFKGGSLASTAQGTHVLVYAWLLEDAGNDPWVVVMMANSDAGNINGNAMQSVAGRILELVAAQP